MDNSVLGSITRMTGAFERAVADRFAASAESDRLAFFLTTQEQGLELVGINLRDGSEVWCGSWRSRALPQTLT